MSEDRGWLLMVGFFLAWFALGVLVGNLTTTYSVREACETDGLVSTPKFDLICVAKDE